MHSHLHTRHFPTTTPHHHAISLIVSVINSHCRLRASVDGSDPDCKDKRDECFAASGVRGNYPQCFLENPDGSLVFVGNFETVESLVECNDIPLEVLAGNPDIKTFNSVFADAAKEE